MGDYGYLKGDPLGACQSIWSHGRTALAMAAADDGTPLEWRGSTKTLVRTLVEQAELGAEYPSQWRVLEDRPERDSAGAPMAKQYIVLRRTDDDHDEARLVITLVPDEEPEVMWVYPCRECGWAETCAEGCHS